mgnify:CR=1 FL=1
MGLSTTAKPSTPSDQEQHRMQELMVTAPGKLAWIDSPSPQLASPDGAIVRPIASASCDLDRRLIAGATPFKPPFAIGHECVAEVLQTGENVRSVQRGDSGKRGLIPHAFWHSGWTAIKAWFRRHVGTCREITTQSAAQPERPVGRALKHASAALRCLPIEPLLAAHRALHLHAWALAESVSNWSVLP